MTHLPAPEDDTVCPHCGEMNPSGANFCQNCGKSVARAESASAAEGSAGATVAIRVEDVQKMREKLTAETAPPDSDGDPYVAFKSDIGKKHVNQDAGGAWSWTREDGTRASLLVVADGVSAGRQSEAASRLTVDVLYSRVAPLLQDGEQDVNSALAVLLDAIREANHQVAARPHVAVANADATTVVALLTIGGEAGGAWVGDSRVYLVSDGRISRLTRDHSWAEGVVSQGLMTAEQAASDPRAHMIMRWLGPPDQEDPGVEAFQLQIQPGDILFCCTDGLYMYFAPPVASPEEMAAVFGKHKDHLSAALDELVGLALARGGYDNITISAVQVPTGPISASQDTEDTEEIPGAGSTVESGTIRMRMPFERFRSS